MAAHLGWNLSMSIVATDIPRSDRTAPAARATDTAGDERLARTLRAFERAARAGYFRAMGEADTAHLALGVTPDRVIQHLREAMRPQHLRPAVAGVLHLADVALAAACIDADRAAWDLLRQRAERALVRAGASFHTGRHAVLRARRLLAEVEAATIAGERATVDLRRYAGDAPLRAWLVERLMAGIARDLATQSGGRRSSQEGAAGRLESTLRLLRAEALRERAPLRRAEGEPMVCEAYTDLDDARG
jgi:hypothetical protein